MKIMKQKIKQVLAKRPRRKKSLEKSLEQAIKGIPRITNETVAEHREEVLSSARKYIYPLQHSAHRVVIISTGLAIIGVLAFFTYSLLALYRFNTSSTFMYRVVQVIPFPVARAGSDFVSYENYLFELRHYKHYYETQQKVDFNTDSGRRQLEAFRERALEGVINDAYVKQLARKHNVTVSDQEVNDQIEIVKAQNRIGNDPKVFEDVLREFWDWSVADFKRELKQQLLAQKVVSTLDTDTHVQAQQALAKVKAGGDFTEIAKQHSKDQNTAPAGGDYGITITRSSREVPIQIVNQLFKMNAGQTSEIINTGVALEIVKLKEMNGTEAKAAHIAFPFKDIETYLKPLRDKEKPRQYITP